MKKSENTVSIPDDCSGDGPCFSIIVPVYNETRTIGPLLTHLSSFSHPNGMEVIVVDGNPAGNTIRGIPAATGSVALKTITAEKGRGVQMNAGASIAGGRILLFLHADTRLAEDALQQIESVFAASEEVVGGAFDLAIDSPRPAYRMIERVSSIRSRITRIPYGDQAIFMKAVFFRQVGGFDPIPIMEDVAFMRRVKKQGGRIAILPSRVWTSSRRWEQEGIALCTLRNWILIVLYFCGASPDCLSRFYVKQ